MKSYGDSQNTRGILMNPILSDFTDSFKTERLLVSAGWRRNGRDDAIRTSLPELKP